MSNLLVQNIKHTNGTTAQTVDSSGRVTTPARPAFSIKTINNTRFGTDHSDTSYDLSYLSPLALFTDAHRTTEINVGGGTLSFPSHPTSGNYLKYAVPVTGIYVLGWTGVWTVHNAGDFFGYGWGVNTASEASSGTPTHFISGHNDPDASCNASGGGTCIASLTADDYVVPYTMSASDVQLDSAIGVRCFGYLLG